MKAHPALFEGRGEPKKVALLFQFTFHIHIRNAQTAKARTLCVHCIEIVLRLRFIVFAQEYYPLCYTVYVTSPMKRTVRGMELLVVQYCREDADFNKKRSSRSDKKCQDCVVSKFHIFSRKFYPIFRVLQFVGIKIMGGEKKVLKKIWGGGIFFYFSKISLGIIFIFHSLYPYKFHLH